MILTLEQSINQQISCLTLPNPLSIAVSIWALARHLACKIRQDTRWVFLAPQLMRRMAISSTRICWWTMWAAGSRLKKNSTLLCRLLPSTERLSRMVLSLSQSWPPLQPISVATWIKLTAISYRRTRDPMVSIHSSKLMSNKCTTTQMCTAMTPGRLSRSAPRSPQMVMMPKRIH